MTKLNDTIADINAKIREIREIKETTYALFEECEDPVAKDHYADALLFMSDAIEYLLDSVSELVDC